MIQLLTDGDVEVLCRIAGRLLALGDRLPELQSGGDQLPGKEGLVARDGKLQ
jgi:hypothetical protein